MLPSLKICSLLRGHLHPSYLPTSHRCRNSGPAQSSTRTLKFSLYACCFFLLFLYYFCEDSTILSCYTTLSVGITNGACWWFCLLLKCPHKPASQLLENRIAPQRILWLQLLHTFQIREIQHGQQDLSINL